jgi:putative acetyltransferase
MIIRNETSSDIEAISKVTIAAFKNLAISNHTEQYIVNALREANALTISLVAEIDGQMVGHIAFSPVTISDGATGWFGLGPVSVLPEYQKKGIGKSLISEGLSLLKKSGGQGCVLVGHPDYYKRLGFQNFPELVHEGVPQEVFLSCRLPKRFQKALFCFMKGSGQRANQPLEPIVTHGAAPA